MSFEHRAKLEDLQRSLKKVASYGAVNEVSMLRQICASENFIIKIGGCSSDILKLARDLSKIATTYYGKGGAGLLLVCKEDGTILMLKRSKHVEQPMTWGIPGGALSKGEGWHKKEDIAESGFSNDDFIEAAFREADEELFSKGGTSLDKSKMTLIGETEFKDGAFTYKTFVYDIPLEEKKRISGGISLNWENDKAKWYSLSDLPQNLHFGVKFTKENLEQQGIKLFENRYDELDWIREYLSGLLSKVSEESHQAIGDLIEKVSVMIPAISSKPADEERLDFIFRRDIAVHEFFNYAIKEISRLGERKVAIEMMNYAANFAKKPKDKYSSVQDKDLNKLPAEQQAAHSGYFYHGSELRNAISILKSGTFVGAGAFTRLSLTSDINVASKFGDTIFVFDAKKLQRSGAKKMNYGKIGDIEKIRRQTGKPIDENYLKNPWITDLYRYEREWVLPLPYQMKPGDLVKIIYFSNTKDRDTGSGYNNQYSSANEAFAALDAATDVPVEVMNYPSFGSYFPTTSKRVEPEEIDLTEFVYSNAVSEQSSAEKLSLKYFEDKKKVFGKKEPDKNDPIGFSIYKLYRVIEDFGSYARQLDFKSNYDFGKVFDFYKEIEGFNERLSYDFQDYKYEILNAYGLDYFDLDKAKQFYIPYVEAMKAICKKILSKKEEFKDIVFKKQFGDSSSPKQENYIVRYFVYPSGEPSEIRTKSRDLCAKNIDKILSIPNIKEYLDTHGPSVYGSNYKYYSKDLDDNSIGWKLEDVLRYSNPSLVSDDAYVKHFLSLIDSEGLTLIPDDRLERIAKRYLVEGTPKYAGGEKYNDQWIYNHRNYGSENKKKKLEVIMKAMNEDNHGFAKDEDENT